MEDEYLHAASMQAIKRPEVLADLVGTVSFLTSDDAAFMTGAPAGVLAFSFLSDIASPGPRKSALSRRTSALGGAMKGFATEWRTFRRGL